jgi:uncharacterized protein
MNEVSFLDFDFVSVGLDHGRILSEFLKRYPQSLSGFTAATLTAWSPSYRYEWAFAGPETLIISCVLDSGPHRHLLQPVGTVSPELARKIVAAAAGLPYPLKIVNACDRFLKENLELLKSFSVREARSFSNYLYHTESLARLQGRKYSKKRNLLSQAAGLYRWTTRMLTGELADACLEVLKSIHDEERPEIEGMLAREVAALTFTLKHFNELAQQGLVIFVDDMPAAFSIYEAISPTTVAIHFERALRRFKGLYQVINQETAKVIAEQGYEFINREEDLGDPGLRDAKQSYHPIKIIPSYELTFRNSRAARS